ncbi:MAG: 8-oxo-dGTP pyrophosphatase MutT (NUDIX family) [Hyphomicrobiaceae bacterium]
MKTFPFCTITSSPYLQVSREACPTLLPEFIRSVTALRVTTHASHTCQQQRHAAHTLARNVTRNSMNIVVKKGIAKTLQFYWRRTRGLTMGAQGMILRPDNHVLLIRHTYRPGWHFPGGGVERNETIETALTRELHEEAGVEITSSPELFGLYANFKAFPSDHIAFFVIRSWTQPAVPKPNQEIAEQRFVAPDDLPAGTVSPVRRRLDEVLRSVERIEHW